MTYHFFLHPKGTGQVRRMDSQWYNVQRVAARGAMLANPWYAGVEEPWQSMYRIWREKPFVI